MTLLTIKRLLLLGALGLCVASVARAVAAGDKFVPEEKDLKRAQRQARPLGAGHLPDVRAPLPTQAVLGGNAIIEPVDREVRLGAPLPGLVARIHVKEGDWVEAGAPVVQLADDVEAAAVRVAESDVLVARAALTRTRGALRSEDRRATYAEAEAAKARAALSRQSYERLQKLQAKGAATEEERDRAKWQADSDAAAARAAVERAQAARSGARGDDVAVSARTITQADARLLAARAAQARLVIRAPRAGRILQVLVRPGEYFNPNNQTASWLVTMGDTRRLHVRVDIDERDYARVRLGASAYVTADAFGARRFAGKVIEIGRRMGRKNIRTDEPAERVDTKILEVVLALDGGQNELVAGLRVTAYVTPGDR